MKQLIKAMKNCKQTANQNVLQHGFSVWHYFKDIHDHLKFQKPLKHESRIPEWVLLNKA